MFAKVVSIGQQMVAGQSNHPVQEIAMKYLPRVAAFRGKLLAALAGVLVTTCVPVSQAAVVRYSSLAAFNAAISGWTTLGANYLGLNNPDTALPAGASLTPNFATTQYRADG